MGRMDKRKAKYLGGKFGIRAVTGGILLAQLILTIFFYRKSDGLFTAFFWFTDFQYLGSLISGILILYLSGYFYGQVCGRQVLINHKNYNLVGFKFAMFSLVVSAIGSSAVNFLIVGIEEVGRQGETPIKDYIIMPIYFIHFFGLAPALIIGYWFGKQLRRRLRF